MLFFRFNVLFASAAIVPWALMNIASAEPSHGSDETENSNSREHEGTFEQPLSRVENLSSEIQRLIMDRIERFKSGGDLLQKIGDALKPENNTSDDEKQKLSKDAEDNRGKLEKDLKELKTELEKDSENKKLQNDVIELEKLITELKAVSQTLNPIKPDQPPPDKLKPYAKGGPDALNNGTPPTHDEPLTPSRTPSFEFKPQSNYNHKKPGIDPKTELPDKPDNKTPINPNETLSRITPKVVNQDYRPSSYNYQRPSDSSASPEQNQFSNSFIEKNKPTPSAFTENFFSPKESPVQNPPNNPMDLSIADNRGADPVINQNRIDPPYESVISLRQQPATPSNPQIVTNSNPNPIPAVPNNYPSLNEGSRYGNNDNPLPSANPSIVSQTGRPDILYDTKTVGPNNVKEGVRRIVSSVGDTPSTKSPFQDQEQEGAAGQSSRPSSFEYSNPTNTNVSDSEPPQSSWESSSRDNTNSYASISNPTQKVRNSPIQENIFESNQKERPDRADQERYPDSNYETPAQNSHPVGTENWSNDVYNLPDLSPEEVGTAQTNPFGIKTKSANDLQPQDISPADRTPSSIAVSTDEEEKPMPLPTKEKIKSNSSLNGQFDDFWREMDGNDIDEKQPEKTDELSRQSVEIQQDDTLTQPVVYFSSLYEKFIAQLGIR